MIELRRNELVFAFPEVHEKARLRIEFQRTLRIPDDGRTHYLPPGLGAFPLKHVDDHAERLPESWRRHGGVMLPMYQSEALWIYFRSEGWPAYPFAIRIAAGKINAVTGDEWADGLHFEPQDYVVSPGQPWLDGFCVEKGTIRQFVAMPLGSGYSVEEQVTGEAQFGGLQIAAYPAKRAFYEELVKRYEEPGMFSRRRDRCCSMSAMSEMGLGMGGRMRQEIYEDEYGADAWDTGVMSRCFVHISNSLVWREITGENPPTVPPTAREYANAGLPWFDYYGEGEKALDGSKVLSKLKSIVTLGKEKGDVPLPENQSVTPGPVIKLGRGKNRVREGEF